MGNFVKLFIATAVVAPAKFGLVRHIKVLYRLLDPVRSSAEHTTSAQAEVRRHCLAAFTISLVAIVYGVFGLQYEATGRIHLASSLADSPFIFIHQICPRSVWRQMEFAVGWMDSATTLLLLTVLMTNAPVREQFRYYLSVTAGQQHQHPLLTIGGRPLSGEETGRLLSVRRRVMVGNAAVLLYFNALVNGYFLGNVWLNGVYQRSITSLLYWLLFFPLFIGYLLYGNKRERERGSF